MPHIACLVTIDRVGNLFRIVHDEWSMDEHRIVDFHADEEQQPNRLLGYDREGTRSTYRDRLILRHVCRSRIGDDSGTA